MQQITLDGIIYKLTPIEEDPTFKVLDMVSYDDSDVIQVITSLSDDRYYLDFSPDYILFSDQSKYNKRGDAVLINKLVANSLTDKLPTKELLLELKEEIDKLASKNVNFAKYLLTIHNKDTINNIAQTGTLLPAAETSV